MRRGVGMALVSSACIALGVLALQATTVTVPWGTAPVLDGVLSEGEWSGAYIVRLNADERLFLQHADGYLYLGVQATALALPTPLVVRGDEVRALHASAALATAVYGRSGDVWNLRQGYVWQCRTLGFSEFAMAERARFLEQQGWLGTIANLGEPSQCEYQIAWGDGPLTFLFLLLVGPEPLRFASWPMPAAEAAQYEALVMGGTPAQITCSLNGWATLEKGE
jgi:hypothetical protein